MSEEYISAELAMKINAFIDDQDYDNSVKFYSLMTVLSRIMQKEGQSHNSIMQVDESNNLVVVTEVGSTIIRSEDIPNVGSVWTRRSDNEICTVLAITNITNLTDVRYKPTVVFTGENDQNLSMTLQEFFDAMVLVSEDIEQEVKQEESSNDGGNDGDNLPDLDMFW